MLQPGTRVRFATPNFVKRGVVVKHRPPSLVIDVDGEHVVIPLADWYLEQPPDAPEHITAIDADDDRSPAPRPIPDDAEAFLYTFEAAALVNIEEKQLRRWIRRNRVPAHKNAEGRWILSREVFMDFARDNGWI